MQITLESRTITFNTPEEMEMFLVGALASIMSTFPPASDRLASPVAVLITKQFGVENKVSDVDDMISTWCETIGAVLTDSPSNKKIKRFTKEGIAATPEDSQLIMDSIRGIMAKIATMSNDQVS